MIKLTKKQFSALLYVLEKEESRYSIYGIYVDTDKDNNGILVSTSTTGLVILEKLDNPGDLKGKILKAPKLKLHKDDKGVNIIKQGDEYFYSFIDKHDNTRYLEKIIFLEKTFPDYKRILDTVDETKEKKSEYSICINPNKIPPSFENVEFKFFGKQIPFKCIPYRDKECENMCYVVMPMRHDV